jgi:hypothetical protein
MRKLFLAILVCIFAMSVMFVSAVPDGASNVTEINSTRLSPSSPTSHNATAGNVTELSIYGESVTKSWQGYFGNVTGAIRLGNALGDILYNWSVASPRGQIYASTAQSIQWSTIDCFNVSNQAEVESLEDDFNIGHTDADGVNETFTLNDHSAFNVGSTGFAEGQCPNVKLFNNAGVGLFDNVLLKSGANVVFASLLKEDAVGFDNRPHDFQMIVLEDGHGTNTDTTPYYFHVEIY